jgi:hypothetical protein
MRSRSAHVVGIASKSHWLLILTNRMFRIVAWNAGSELVATIVDCTRATSGSHPGQARSQCALLVLR